MDKLDDYGNGRYSVISEMFEWLEKKMQEIEQAKMDTNNPFDRSNMSGQKKLT